MNQEKSEAVSLGDLLLEFELPINIHAFVSTFLEDSANFYEKYLAKCLGDTDISISEWVAGKDSWRRRVIDSKHPIRIKLPVLPAYGQSKKVQEYCFFEGPPTKIIVKELTCLVGVPYGDYFSVLMTWKISTANNKDYCFVQTYVEVSFYKSTWLKSQIKANTKSETKESCESYRNFALDWLELQAASRRNSSLINIEKRPCAFEARSAENSVAHRPSHHGHLADEDAMSDDDEFHECLPLCSTEYDEERAFIMAALENNRAGDERASFEQTNGYSTGNQPENSSVTMVLQYVESMIVVTEWLSWHCSFLSMKSVRLHFSLSLEQALKNLRQASLPYRGVTGAPDLYVPLMVMFSLAQIFLLCMDVTKHKCRRETLLGNSLAVSFNVWLGTSTMYFLLSYLLVSRVTFLQSLASTGYALFGWCLALFSAHMLTFCGIGQLGVELILLILGGPSAWNLAMVFWREHPLPRTECLRNRIIIALPKLGLFMIVAGTHYQFLRYLYNDFLKGNKELCRISSVLNPKEFANIVTQKQIRKYANSILKRSR